MVDDMRRDDELDLGDEGERLPWLSDDDNHVEQADSGRFLGLVLVGLAIVAAIAGIAWFALARTGAGGPEPDGSLIAAPEAPYRLPPEDAGGKEFAGTGATSFAVGEGQTRDGRIAADTERRSLPAPSIDGNERQASAATATPTPTPSPASSPLATRYTAPARGTAVQVGAYSNREDALKGWETLVRQTEALSGVEYRIVEGQADIGRVHRLQAAAGSAEAARNLCAALRSDGLACQVK